MELALLRRIEVTVAEALFRRVSTESALASRRTAGTIRRSI